MTRLFKRGIGTPLFVVTALGAILLSGASRQANALPQFAIRYGLPCSTCHTMAPRLTPFGYKFYRNGYRIPGVKAKAADLFDTMSFFTYFSFQDTNPGGNTGFNLDGAEAQLATPITNHLTTKVMYEFSSQSEASSGFAEAWGQYNVGSENNFFTLRAGQIPVLSGFKLAGDRDFSINDAMMFGSNGPLYDNGQGNFGIAGLERGVELGYTNHNVTGKISWLNGVDSTGAGDVTLVGHRASDYMLQGDWLIGNEGSSLSAFYYHGVTPFPATTDLNNNPVNSFTDIFNRMGLFASLSHTFYQGDETHLPFSAELNYGAMWGKDKVDSAGDTANSFGNVLEADGYLGDRYALMARYDTIKGSDQLGSPLNATTEAYTFTLAMKPTHYVRYQLEYRNQMRPGNNSLMGAITLFY